MDENKALSGGSPQAGGHPGSALALLKGSPHAGGPSAAHQPRNVVGLPVPRGRLNSDWTER